jgi:hypothetical protein
MEHLEQYFLASLAALLTGAMVYTIVTALTAVP